MSFKILHVQTTAPNTDLQQVANLFAEAIKDGASPVVTNTSIMTSVEVRDGEPPIDTIYVRGALNPAQVAEIAYAALTPADRGSASWSDLSDDQRSEYVATVVNFLNEEPNPSGADNYLWSEEGERAFHRVVEALVPFLISPTSDPVTKVWTGSCDLTVDSAFITLPLSRLPEHSIFKLDTENSRYYAAASRARKLWTADSVRWVVDAVPAIVSGTKPLDESDITKGFTLTWKIDYQPNDEGSSSTNTDPHSEEVHASKQEASSEVQS